ncbi:MAG: arsenite methyltransferase [Candidatus Caldatribacteriaceae bacterium]
MTQAPEEKIKQVVREGYAFIAQESASCCGNSNSCCGGAEFTVLAEKLGYSEEELDALPEGANLGLGCGNPLAFTFLEEGQVVLDLGCGAGMDCFLAARRVGPNGKVIGVDMTPEMIHRAREIARKEGYQNVEFLLGEIESLPLPDGFCDRVISNCVINLSPQKGQVFREAFRVLKSGGQLVLSDIVLNEELPPEIKGSDEAYVGCIAGAILREEYLRLIRKPVSGKCEL